MESFSTRVIFLSHFTNIMSCYFFNGFLYNKKHIILLLRTLTIQAVFVKLYFQNKYIPSKNNSKLFAIKFIIIFNLFFTLYHWFVHTNFHKNNLLNIFNHRFHHKFNGHNFYTPNIQSFIETISVLYIQLYTITLLKLSKKQIYIIAFFGKIFTGYQDSKYCKKHRIHHDNPKKNYGLFL